MGNKKGILKKLTTGFCSYLIEFNNEPDLAMNILLKITEQFPDHTETLCMLGII